VVDHERLGRDFLRLFATWHLVVERVTHGKAVRPYTAERLQAILGDDDTFGIAARTDDGVEGLVYLRDGDAPGSGEFTDRGTGLVLPARATGDAAVAAVALLAEHFGLISANVACHADRHYAVKECIRAGVAGSWDPATVERIRWDVWKWRRARTQLVRLTPLTIIGPEIWAQLPPMPAFEPAPTVENLGTCKILKAWPTLCDPRDPSFLRGTRALREWLWPYTIQNPADHVDNDPPGGD
jgi:hypothetical protein